jgi:hypothetical protein
MYVETPQMIDYHAASTSSTLFQRHNAAGKQRHKFTWDDVDNGSNLEKLTTTERFYGS